MAFRVLIHLTRHQTGRCLVTEVSSAVLFNLPEDAEGSVSISIEPIIKETKTFTFTYIVGLAAPVAERLKIAVS